VAAVEALNGTQDNIAVRRDVFQRRRDLSVAVLNDIPGISCRAPEGAFYAFADIRELVANPEVIKKQIRNDKELCHYFLHECGVAIVPGSCFGGEGFIRLSYATSDKALSAALERMKNGVLRLLGHQE
jgi:aspartate aminotransferase